MKLIKRFCGLFLLCFILSVPLTAQVSVWKANDPNRQEIKSLHDIFSITSGWHNSSNDDATILFSRNGLAGPDGAGWPVYINGNRMHLQTWNTQSLYLLPVSIAQIDSVVIIESPMLYKGSFTDKGGVFIYTKKGDYGMQAEGNITYGNRSGDPGPFVYTEIATQNIERQGPIMDALVSYNNNKYGLLAGFKYFVHEVTDVMQYRRLVPFEFGDGRYRYEMIRSTSVYLKGHYNTAKFSHNIQSGATGASDFLFTKLYGTEIPVDRKWGFVSIDGLGDIYQNLKLSYGFNHNLNNTKEYPNKEDRWLRWKQQVTTSKSSITHHFDKGFQQAGIEASFYGLEDEESANRTLNSHLLSLFHQFNFELWPELKVHSNLKAVKGKKVALKANAGMDYQANATNTFLIDATYSQRLPEEDNSLWYWMAEKGFGSDTLAEFHPSELPTRAKFLQAKLGWNTSIPEKFDLNLALVFSRNIDEYIMSYRLIPNGSRIASGEFDFINDLNASFLRIPVKFTIDILPSVRQTLNYTWTHQVEGDAAFFDMIPTHRLSSNLKWQPVDSFILWTRFKAQSEINWAVAEPIDGMEVRVNFNQTEYSSTTAALFQWDVGIKKYFWEQRVALSLDMQNINDQKFRNHPVGPRHAFTLFLGLHIDVP